MKRTLKALLAMSALVLALPLCAQTSLTQTTLSSAVTSASATSIVVASATGITAPSPFAGNVAGGQAGTELIVDQEAMLVTAVNGTTINVVRGANSTIGSPHGSGSIVWVATPSQLYTIVPVGACTATGTVNPYINVLTGQFWFCDSSTGNWQPVFSTGAITPVATSAAIQTAAQTFTVKGLATGEPVVVVSQPAPTSLCPLVAARVTAANTVSLYFTTLTAAACTPASGSYFLLAPRLNIP
jgi:hypothetical protein